MPYAKDTFAIAREVGLTPKQVVNFPSGLGKQIELFTKKKLTQCSRAEFESAYEKAELIAIWRKGEELERRRRAGHFC